VGRRPAVHRAQHDPEPCVLPAPTWDSIGYAHHHLGRYPQAITSYERGLTLARACGNKRVEAEILGHLGDTLLVTASRGTAHQVLRQALAILDQLGHPDTESIRARLRS
jgi:tetratricopeptide (TPR) repeat protein